MVYVNNQLCKQWCNYAEILTTKYFEKWQVYTLCHCLFFVCPCVQYMLVFE